MGRSPVAMIASSNCLGHDEPLVGAFQLCAHSSGRSLAARAGETVSEGLATSNEHFANRRLIDRAV